MRPESPPVSAQGDDTATRVGSRGLCAGRRVAPPLASRALYLEAFRSHRGSECKWLLLGARAKGQAPSFALSGRARLRAGRLSAELPECARRLVRGQGAP